MSLPLASTPSCARFARAYARTLRPYLRSLRSRRDFPHVGGRTKLPKLRDIVIPMCYVDARQFATSEEDYIMSHDGNTHIMEAFWEEVEEFDTTQAIYWLNHYDLVACAKPDLWQWDWDEPEDEEEEDA